MSVPVAAPLKCHLLDLVETSVLARNTRKRQAKRFAHERTLGRAYPTYVGEVFDAQVVVLVFVVSQEQRRDFAKCGLAQIEVACSNT